MKAGSRATLGLPHGISEPLPPLSGEKRRETIYRVGEALGDLINETGSVLTNGWQTLAPAPLYVMGLNPGGAADEHDGYTVRRNLEGLRHDEGGLQFGDNPNFRNNTRAMVAAFGFDADKVFMTNAIFPRTGNATGLNGKAIDLFEACWPVHAWFLSIVRPKVVLCLGNGTGKPSAAGLLARKAGVEWSKAVHYASDGPTSSRFRDGCWFRAELPVAGREGEKLSCIVVGAPHPSRFGATEAFRGLAQRLAVSSTSSIDVDRWGTK